jgi:hypothetical protein
MNRIPESFLVLAEGATAGHSNRRLRLRPCRRLRADEGRPVSGLTDFGGRAS